MRRLVLAPEARSDAEPGQPHLAGRGVDQDIGRLDVLVDKAALVKLAESRGSSAAEAQEASHLHGLAEQLVEWLAARILEHQHRPTGVAHEVQRPYRPRSVELLLQFEFVSQAIEAGAGRLIGGRNNGQHGAPFAVILQSPAAVEDAFAVLP